jgi:2-polyprenyl-3-methyl-5-hydroxy-6-metoxy-1,4-benzoquinol methylase
MGYARELYTDNYYQNLYTKRTKNGPRPDQLVILSKIRWSGKTVLDIGCGCGEMLYFCLSRSANRVVGIDFSIAAINYAKQALRNNNSYELICNDALIALRSIKEKFDYVLMLDSIEHIPASEIDEILENVYRICKNILIVQTPYYSVYDDYEAQGFYNNETASDKLPETRGMHCTKYTKDTLIAKLLEHNFKTRDALHFRRCNA